MAIHEISERARGGSIMAKYEWNDATYYSERLKIPCKLLCVKDGWGHQDVMGRLVWYETKPVFYSDPAYRGGFSKEDIALITQVMEATPIENIPKSKENTK